MPIEKNYNPGKKQDVLYMLRLDTSFCGKDATFEPDAETFSSDLYKYFEGYQGMLTKSNKRRDGKKNLHLELDNSIAHITGPHASYIMED